MRVHISVGGPTYVISAGKLYYFEDHPYCGPMFTNKRGDGLQDPKPTDHVWHHINAWYRQGKQYQENGRLRWCKYTTDMQEARELGRQARAAAALAAEPVPTLPLMAAIGDAE